MKTMLDKVWDAHVVRREAGCPDVLYVDLHLVHEVTSPQAFASLIERGVGVRCPERTLATMDHSTPTVRGGSGSPRPPPTSGGSSVERRSNEPQFRALEESCARFGIELHGLDSPHNGIVHVIGPELGRTQPGMTIVCGDSHTSTHGAFGALAFGIGTSEVAHVLATQCLLQHRPRTMRVRFEGALRPIGVTAKDLTLAVIAAIGADGGTGHVIEYQGDAVRALSMEERMTLCNMSIEAGARAGMIAPDDTTFEYLCARTHVSDESIARWRGLASDDGAAFDREVTIDARIAPRITWGTSPAMSVAIDEPIPIDADKKALAYMALEAGRPLLGHPIDVVFIGSCTNSRLSDLRDAARIFAGRAVKRGVRTLVVPGSRAVQRAAEAEGLDEIFRAAGAEWRDPGCSMCIAMNGDHLDPGQYAVSTSNRNFEGRQGPGGRTFLASPLTAAACAVTGVITDVRTFREVHSP
jgi:3-isopropylmalate/(R)-2-methylmalate dehydratase large subunit